MSNLGIPYVPGLTIESACGSGSVMLREAFANVYAGFYDCVLAVGVEKITHTGTTQSTTLFFGTRSDFFYEGGNGASFPGLFASIARAYLSTYKATEEDLAYVAVKNHENGILNPKAHVRRKITIDEVMNSPVVASPLKLYDCCPFSDGASALILCNEKFAKSIGRPYMEIIGSGRGASPWLYKVERTLRLYQVPSMRQKRHIRWQVLLRVILTSLKYMIVLQLRK